MPKYKNTFRDFARENQQNIWEDRHLETLAMLRKLNQRLATTEDTRVRYLAKITG